MTTAKSEGEKEQTSNSSSSSVDKAKEFQEKVYKVIEKVRPFLHMEGGDIEIVEFIGYDVKVRLTGACQHCPSSIYTLKLGIEQALKKEIPEFGSLIPVETGDNFE